MDPLEELRRERDEAREAARELFKEIDDTNQGIDEYYGGSGDWFDFERSEVLYRYPWLEEE